MPLILASNSASGGYEVDNSLRFNAGSSDFLNKTFGTATNRKIFTISVWTKRSKLGDPLVGATGKTMFSGGIANSAQTSLEFTNTNVFSFMDIASPYSAYNFIVRSSETNLVIRDLSAWYHLVVAYDSTQATASNRLKLYVNGSQVTSFSATDYPTLNYEPYMNNNIVHRIGNTMDNTFGDRYYDGYLSEFNFIDGQALTPTSFGETNTLSGIWIPKAYTGTFGTNGFYQKYANSAALGTDSSGNGNTFTVNNLTSLDQTTDTCTNNWCTLNAVDNIASSGSGTLTQGNTNVAYTGGGFNTNATIAANKGKWYWETKAVANTTQGFVGMRLGFQEIPNTYSEANTLENASFGMYAHPTAGVYSVVNGSGVSRGAGLTYVDGDIIGIALDLDNNISYWYLNGSLSVTYDFSSLSTIGTKNLVPAVGNGAGSANPELNLNFGNPSITIASGNADANGYGNFEYAVPAGYYSLNTKNLAEFG